MLLTLSDQTGSAELEANLSTIVERGSSRDTDRLLTAVNARLLLERRGDIDAAEALWQGAADLPIPEVAGPAALNLGHLLLEQEDLNGAAIAFERAATVGEPEVQEDARRALQQLREGE